jgi:hypothetical protein
MIISGLHRLATLGVRFLRRMPDFSDFAAGKASFQHAPERSGFFIFGYAYFRTIGGFGYSGANRRIAVSNALSTEWWEALSL